MCTKTAIRICHCYRSRSLQTNRWLGSWLVDCFWIFCEYIYCLLRRVGFRKKEIEVIRNKLNFTLLIAHVLCPLILEEWEPIKVGRENIDRHIWRGVFLFSVASVQLCSLNLYFHSLCLFRLMAVSSLPQVYGSQSNWTSNRPHKFTYFPSIHIINFFSNTKKKGKEEDGLIW